MFYVTSILIMYNRFSIHCYCKTIAYVATYIQLSYVTRSTKTVPNCTSGRWHFSLPIESCNNILMSHASTTVKVQRSTSPVAGFLGMSDVHECPVGFKWLWWPFTSRHLAVNWHTTANWCYPLIWLYHLKHK